MRCLHHIFVVAVFLLIVSNEKNCASGSILQTGFQQCANYAFGLWQSIKEHFSKIQEKSTEFGVNAMMEESIVEINKVTQTIVNKEIQVKNGDQTDLRTFINSRIPEIMPKFNRLLNYCLDGPKH